MTIKPILELRNKLKERKPDFIRQDYGRRKRIKAIWRKPKGIHSKIRHHFKGRRKMPSPGYKSPVKVRGIHASGLKIVNISSPDDIKLIKKESEGIVISKSVGMKKRLEILKKAKNLQIQILNLNVDEHIKKIEDFINSKKKPEAKETKKQEIKEKKETKPKETVKTQLTDEQKKEANLAEKPKEKPGELSEKEKKEAEKKEKDKILTKKV